MRLPPSPSPSSELMQQLAMSTENLALVEGDEEYQTLYSYCMNFFDYKTLALI